jgi:hypothetical protein
MKVLQLYSCAGSFQLSLDVLSLSLRSSLLNSLRSFLNQSLSLLQAQTCDLLNSLDNCHLVVAEGSEYNVELSLLSLSCCAACCGACCCYNCSYTELLLDSVNELFQLKNRHSLDFFYKIHNLLRSHD